MIPISQVRDLPSADELSQLPQDPHYRAYKGWLGSDALRRLDTARILEHLRAAEARAFVSREGAAMHGLASWHKLAWDSQLFGFPAARIDVLRASGEYGDSRAVLAALLEAVTADCRCEKVRHLMVRVDASDLPAIHALEGAGYELIDGIQTFSLSGGRPSGRAGLQAGCRKTTIQVRGFEAADLDQVLAIARGSYRYDRFHADAALSPQTADAVNEAWVRNSCLGTAADHVLVAADDAAVLGYVTCKLDRGTRPHVGVTFGNIVMVATAAPVRGRGVARAATAGALAWFREQGADIVEVGTQLRNVPAGRLYEACGFRLTAASLTWRKLL